jgi:hypothetical protein
MGVLIRAKATSQILTLAHRCGVCNERLLIRRRVEGAIGQGHLLSRLFCSAVTRFASWQYGGESVAADGAALPGEGDQAWRRGYLGRTTTAGSELANVVEEDGALQVVELRGVHGDLGEEGVGHENRCLVAMARVGVSQESGDIDLKGPGQTVERREGRHCFAVLNLRNVGARDAHAGGELPLR